MPPDVDGLVRKFVPNNPKLAKIITKLLNSEFRSRTLPDELVKHVVRRAFELERDMEVEIDSTVFNEKLKLYVVQIKPRYLAKINQVKNTNRKW